MMDMTIAGLLTAYRQQTLTPEQVIDHVLNLCDQYIEHNIWITRLSREQIHVYLNRLQNQNPASLPLYGIPFAIKDNIDLQAVETTAACPAFTYTPERSAFVVQQLMAAGAIPIGKTNMDQFATGLVGTRSPAPWGTCKNAFNKDYISGGSSSGSAVAVALGLVAFALGTDTAGSGRVPAAYNNIIGVKPTRGLISTSGVVPACRSLDCVSIFANTTDDANTVLEVAVAFDGNDPYARHNPYQNNQRHYGSVGKGSAGKGQITTRLKIAVPNFEQVEFFGNSTAQRLFTSSITRLLRMGAAITEIDFTPFLDAARLLYQGPWVAERYVAIENIISGQPDALLPEIRTIIGGAKNKSATEYFKAEYQLQKYRQQAQQIFNQYDCIVTPTAGTIYRIDEVQSDPIQLNSNLGYYTNFMNLLDCSAIAMPAGFLDNRCGFGITFIGPAMSDRKLLSIANLWQQNFDLTLGATQQPLPASTASEITISKYIPVVVCGAHLTGLPLNWQLAERGATCLEKIKTAKKYRMYALPGGPPYRPGLIRVDSNGVAIESEVWAVPQDQFGSFVANIPAPLGIGKIELTDGRWLPGFICEGYITKDATDISEYGSWIKYLESLS